MSNGFELEPSDVVSMDEDSSPIDTPTFKVSQLTYYLADRSINDEYVKAWTASGVECEVLVAGKGWQKGKVLLSLHFIPDEPSNKSPLDDLRNDLNI